MTAAVKWEGAESLRALLVPVESLRTHPENARRGDVQRIGESLAEFGQLRPILVRKETGEIVAGNHTYRAGVEERGWSHVAAVVEPMDEEKARAYLVADNRLADLAEYDYEAEIALLTRLQDGGDLAGTGWTADEIDDEIARLGAIAETEPEPFQGGLSESPESLAAREAARAASPIQREFLIMLDPDRYARFRGWVSILEKEYGTQGSIETVYRAVENETRRVNLDAAPEAAADDAEPG